MPAMPVIADSVCPLDCPDTCSLSVTVEDGRLTTVDGSRRNPFTAGFICAKVRRYAERVYSPLRVRLPAAPHRRERRGALRAHHAGTMPSTSSPSAGSRSSPPTAPRRSCRITTAAPTACSAKAPPTRASSTASAPRSC